MEKKVTLPILPHLKKWIRKKYGRAMIYADSSTAIGITLQGLAALRCKAASATERYTEGVTVVFSIKQSRYEIRSSFVVSANAYFNKLFQEEMFAYIEALYKEGVPRFQAVERFLDMYDIEEGEFQKNSAYRAYMRHNERLRPSEEKLTKLSQKTHQTVIPL
jgi:hypothetical protein